MANQEINQNTTDREDAPSKGRLASSVGMALPDGRLRVFLPKGSRIPCEHPERFLARLKDYNKVRIKIFMGDAEFVKDNIFLGEVGLDNIRLNNKGEALLDVIFSIDSEGLLHIQVRDDPGKQSSNATLRIPSDIVPSPVKTKEPETEQEPASGSSREIPDQEMLLDKLSMLEEKIRSMEEAVKEKTDDKESGRKSKTREKDEEN